MNLQPLFEIQRKLDEKIIKKKGLEGQDLLPQKILALQVELGECANEWRGFKFWSDNREPRTIAPITQNEKGGWVGIKNPLLEEYVDCLHFILSIGNDLKLTNIVLEPIGEKDIKNVLEAFQYTFNWLVNLEYYYNHTVVGRVNHAKCYKRLFETFLRLGEMLGFTWEQIEQAYLEKNKINHKRQESDY